jgi:APA family basic amino acid/polyamine antiporter
MTNLVRGLNFWDALAIVVGSIIGTGVFLKASIMAHHLGSATAVLAAWIVAGLLSLCGALTYAEIGSRFPVAGGEYIYLRETYGRLVAFLYGWTRFWVGSPASIAAYGVGAATFLASVVSLSSFSGPSGVAIAFVLLFTVINCAAVSVGGKIQTFLTGLKVVLIIGVTAGIFAFSSGGSGVGQEASTATGGFSMGAFSLALIAALWAFDGWNNLPMAAGEVKNPQRNIPIAIVFGTAGVVVVYTAINAAYFYSLPFDAILKANSSLNPDAPAVATLATASFLGAGGTAAMSLLFVLSALGSMNGSILTNARVPYAMARDGLFFMSLGKIDEKTSVPIKSILIQGALACGLALSGSFDQLTDYVVVTSWIFYALVGVAVFLARRRTDLPAATYHTFAYPYLPALFVVASVALLVNTLIASPRDSLVGLGFVMLGIPVYGFMARGR